MVDKSIRHTSNHNEHIIMTKNEGFAVVVKSYQTSMEQAGWKVCISSSESSEESNEKALQIKKNAGSGFLCAPSTSKQQVSQHVEENVIIMSKTSEGEKNYLSESIRRSKKNNATRTFYKCWKCSKVCQTYSMIRHHFQRSSCRFQENTSEESSETNDCQSLESRQNNASSSSLCAPSTSKQHVTQHVEKNLIIMSKTSEEEKKYISESIGRSKENNATGTFYKCWKCSKICQTYSRIRHHLQRSSCRFQENLRG